MLKKLKPLGASLINIENSKLVHYRIIPDYTINNDRNIVISNSVASIYKNFLQRKIIGKSPLISIEDKKKIYFNILLLPNGANFYISFPEKYEDMFLNKMQTIWNHSAIKKIDVKELQQWVEEETEISEMMLKDYNFKSLNTDKSNLYPLTNLLGLIKQLKCNEKVMINFDIEPIKRLDWVNKAKDEYKSYDKGYVIDNTKTTLQELISNIYKVLEVLLNIYIEFRLLIFESMAGLIGTEKEEKDKIELNIDSLKTIRSENKLNGLSASTRHKMASKAYKIAINIMSQSKDKHRREINLIASANAYKDLTGNNELILKRISKKRQQAKFKKIIHFESKTTTIENKSIYSDRELAKFIQLPQKTLQTEYSIENIDERELEIHDDLMEKGIKIGTANKQKENINVYWCNDYNSMALSKVVAGPQGAGKDKYTENFIVDANKLGHCTIVFDYIKNCELTANASNYTKKNVFIDLSNTDDLFAFSYPEISKKMKEKMQPFNRLLIANDIAKQVKYLVNAINDENIGPLSPPMKRFLVAAAKVVFIHPNEKVDNVFKVLEDWETRGEYIRKSKGVYEYNDRILNTLRELNEHDENGKIIGTRHHLISGILNRIDILLDDPRLELMLRANMDKHDFTKYMNEGNAVYIKMPEKAFKDPVTKDIIVTYFMTRIRMASLERSDIDKPNIAHVITNEVHHIPTAANFFKNHITEFRKFGIAPYFTIHYLNQFRNLLDAITGSGVSYMLLTGLKKDNLTVLKEEIAPFEIEEAMNLKPFHSLNVIKHNNKYSRFISKLPKPL